MCIPYQAKFPNGACKDIIGYQPVYGININKLKSNERGQSRYQLVKTLTMQQQVYSSGNNALDDFFTSRERCLKMDADVSCHQSFKRCYISSSPQLICREICEDLTFNVCKREYKIIEDFVKSQQGSSYPYTFETTDCSTLPFRNESPNCYYPDEIRGQWKGCVFFQPISSGVFDARWIIGNDPYNPFAQHYAK